MATKQEWKEYFHMMNDREPNQEDEAKALENGEFDAPTTPIAKENRKDTTPQAWREYFHMMNGREPSLKEFQSAVSRGEVDQPKQEQNINFNPNEIQQKAKEKWSTFENQKVNGYSTIGLVGYVSLALSLLLTPFGGINLSSMGITLNLNTWNLFGTLGLLGKIASTTSGSSGFLQDFGVNTSSLSTITAASSSSKFAVFLIFLTFIVGIVAITLFATKKENKIVSIVASGLMVVYTLILFGLSSGIHSAIMKEAGTTSGIIKTGVNSVVVIVLILSLISLGLMIYKFIKKIS